MQIERKTPVLRPALQSKQSLLCGFHCDGGRGRGGPNGQIISIKRAADRRRQRSRKIIDEEREKYRTENRSMQNTSTDSKGAAFVILINHASMPITKKKLNPVSKAEGRPPEMSFWKRAGCQRGLKALEKSIVDRTSKSPTWVC